MNTLKVSVTEEHIKKAMALAKKSDKTGNWDKFYCPISLALQDASGMKTASWAYIRGDSYTKKRNGEITGWTRYTSLTPDITEKFAEEFDEGNPVQPFDFEVTVEAE